MPIARPENTVEEPEGGWPWQMELVWVTAVSASHRGQPRYKIKCKCCGWITKGFADAQRIGLHFRGVKAQGVQTCKWQPKKLQADYPGFWASCLTLRVKVSASPSQQAASQKQVQGTVQVAQSPANGTSSETSKPAKSSKTQLSLDWMTKPLADRTKLKQDCHDAWDMVFFVHNVPFSLISTPEFRIAIKATQQCPVFEPCGRDTLSLSHLDKQDSKASDFNSTLIKKNLRYGFVLTGDGYRSKAKRNYHNFILLTPQGPVFLGLKDVTGEGGCAEDVFDEFVEILEGLGGEVTDAVMLGILDTPSVNVKAWKLLMKKYPTQVWMGCMAHEISLYFGDVNKLAPVKRLHMLGKYLVKWVMNHSGLLALFRKCVRAYFKKQRAATKGRDRSRYANMMSMVLFMPGDTRMLAVFRMLFRILFLQEPLVAMFNHPDYEVIAQKCIKNYNSQCKDATKKKVNKRTSDGKYVDIAELNFGAKSSPIWEEIHVFLQVMTGTVYFHRAVDTHKPALSFVYYMSALVDKQLRLLKDLGKAPMYSGAVHSTFMKRWARWHRPVHTLAYHMAPQFQAHEISNDEKRDCMAACKQLFPTQFTKI